MFKERTSAPPVTQNGFQALKMPDFSKLHDMAKQRSSLPPVPTQAKAFQLQSEARSAAHQKDFQERVTREWKELERMRLFKAQPVPDYKKMNIMPSDRPLTQSMRPVFHADFLPPSRKSVEPAKVEQYPDFKF
jgi:hypothetical protein